MFGCIMSTKTRKIPCFEMSWLNGRMDRAVDGDGEVHLVELTDLVDHVLEF